MGVVLAIVGLSGVGKSQAVSIVSGWLDFEVVYFGGVVLEEVRARGLEVTPSNEALVREELRRDFGMAVMALKTLPRILGAPGHVLIDGLYSQSEYVLLKAELQARLKVIAIHSDKSVRAERLGRRPVRPLTLAEMEERDAKEIARLEKAPPIVLADFHVLNNGDLDRLAAGLRRIVRRVVPAAG